MTVPVPGPVAPGDVLYTPPFPMLARAGKVGDVDGAVARGYQIEPKMDGVRCLAVVDGDSVQLFNRKLVNMTRRFPEVVEQLRLHVYTSTMLGRLVLDGEVFVRGPGGQADFQLVQHRANRLSGIEQAAAEYPALYNAFDVLSSGRVDYKPMTLAERRRILEEVAGPLVLPVMAQWQADDAVVGRVGEGLMLKIRSGRYYAGVRSPAWLKVKYENEIECVVGGVTHGLGKRESYFGALLVGLAMPGDEHGVARLKYVGTVGTGFNDLMLDTLTPKLHSLRTGTNPFGGEVGTDWSLMYWVSPVLKARVRFQDWTRDKVMRFPRFVGLVE